MNRQFHTDLQFSHSLDDYWQGIYKKKFPDALEIFSTGSSKSQAQKLGVDRIILLRSGKVITVEEKNRRKDYADILLEFSSGDRKGWIEQEYICDYLAYGFPSKAYFFPYADLKQVWRKRKHYWKKKFPVVECRNIGYTTESLAIPIDYLVSQVFKNNEFST